MSVKIKKRTLDMSLVALTVLFALWLSFGIMPELISGQAYNTTSLVNTTVNITNSAPEVRAIALDASTDLRSYNTTQVYCNLTTFDFDNDTLEVNATLYLEGTVAADATDDGNNHYTNTTCSPVTNQDLQMNYTCVFDVQYYADNSTQWVCNATVSDSGLVPQSNESDYGTITPLVAIKMDPLLDYGELAVGEISNDTVANITNAGNRPANISVEGYGVTPSDGLAFDCDYGSIDISYERYNVSVNSSYTDMTSLTGSTTQIEHGFYVPQRVSETEDQVNSTFWRVQIPAGAGGVCRGKILFTATDRGS